MKNNIINISNRIALITGGAGYIGSDIAKTLCDEGVRVILADSSKGNLTKINNKLQRKYNKLLDTYLIDLTDDEEVKNLIEYLNKKYKKIDILINSIGMVGTDKSNGWNTDFKYQTKDVWQKALDVNLTSIFFLIQSLQSLLEKSKNASIVNISSIYGKHAPDYDIYHNTNINNPAAYSVSKSGIIYLTKWLAVNLAPIIRVNSISPGGIYRKQDKKFIQKYIKRTLLGRMAKERDISNAVLYLASDLSSYVTGQNLVVDGGWTIK